MDSKIFHIPDDINAAGDIPAGLVLPSQVMVAAPAGCEETSFKLAMCSPALL